MNTGSFLGKIVIVTGGSRGIGKATAKRIGELGGSVSIVARGKEALTEAADEIESAQAGKGQFVETIAADCANMDQLSPLLNEFLIIPGDGGKLAWSAYIADPEGFRAELDAGLVEARKQLGKNG